MLQGQRAGEKVGGWGCPGCICCSERSEFSPGCSISPPTIFPPRSWLKLPTDQAPHQHGSHTLM